MLIMSEFNLIDGLCFLALSYAIDESQVKGIEYRTREYYDFIARRKIEIWEALKNREYKFGK